VASTLVHPTVDDVLASVGRDGYVVVEDLLSPEQVATIHAELDVILDGVPDGRNFFEGFHTKRIYALFAKTRVIDDLAVHPLVLGVLDRVLGEHYLLGGPTGIRIDPGEVAQMLHRDEDQYPIPNPPRDLAFNVLWAFDDFTEANGATRMVPGSQHGALGHADATTPTVPVEMRAGSAAFYLGSVWHGGGANTTDRPRLGLAMLYIAGWLRTQENHSLAVPPAIVCTLPERLQELLGYDVHFPFLGYVDGRHPKRTLRDQGRA
jgi:ectoine hydroxylase-related dioxygenase (phytanoyl-CoA dioxygenase family)